MYLIVYDVYEVIDLTFGERLLYYLERSNMSQKELAERIGVTPTRLNYWVKDKREPDVFHIKALAKALNVTGDDLLGNESNEPDYSDEAKGIAKSFDQLTAAGKELIRSAFNFAEKYHIQRKPLPDDIPLKRIGTYNGAPLFQMPDDMRLPTKLAAKEELKELNAEESAIKE